VAERLATRPDAGQIERRHAGYYRALAEHAARAAMIYLHATGSGSARSLAPRRAGSHGAGQQRRA